MLVASLSLILATLIAADTGVEVHSNADCPKAERIAERLAPLLPDAAPGAARDLAQVEVLLARAGATDLSLRLQRADGSEIGHRYVSLTGTCDDLAEAVAAILAAWESDLKSESEDAPASPAKDEPTPPAKAEPKSAPAVTPTLASALGWQLALGAGGGASFIGGVAASGGVEVVAGQQDSPWQGRVGLSTQGTRTMDLRMSGQTQGQANWQHTSFMASLLWRSRGPDWRFSLDAGPLLGWVGLSGSGLQDSRRSRVFEWGPGAGLRVGRTWGRWTLWIETRAVLWLRNAQATAQNPQSSSAVASGDVPLLDATASLGISRAFFP